MIGEHQLMPAVTEAEIRSAIDHLKQLIRINTINPPGNESDACRYLKTILDREGIACQILEAVPGRGNIIARMKGDGSKKPLLLTSHLDVVPAEPEFWEVDPLSGVERDGFIWGRGAVDMKQMTALELAVFLKAHREKLPLKRDIIFAGVADEEAGCRHGSKWLVENHPELIRAEYAVNEVGGFSLTVDDTVFYPIGVAEKGLCWFNIIAKGAPGHGALPHDDQAINYACLAAHRLASNNLPHHNTPIVDNFIGAIAARQKFPQNLILKAMRNRWLSSLVIKRLLPDKEKARNFWNMFRNLATPTMLKAGQKENVIPSRASVTVDGRFLPGHTVEGFLNEVRAFIGPGFDIEIITAEAALEMRDFDNPFYSAIKNSLKKLDPGCVPVPFLIPGYTDAKHYHKLGIKCYGFAPTKLPAELNFGKMYHGHNERIPVDAIGFGVKALWDVMVATCG